MGKTPGIERFSLSGRRAVTGATRGLGLALARGMAAAGAAVGINGRDPARAREVADDIQNAFPAPFDITDLSAWAEAIAAIVARHGRLDCLVNNAATPMTCSPCSMPSARSSRLRTSLRRSS
jgi:gluconate 5-dehydrogenase